ncbi:unnamed protein product [Symbiodinium sp. KB8]|nr:unnamed protein product [Symbiodinium sp. KB8]
MNMLMLWALIVTIVPTTSPGEKLPPARAEQRLLSEEEHPRGALRHPYLHHEHHEKHDNLAEKKGFYRPEHPPSDIGNILTKSEADEKTGDSSNEDGESHSLAQMTLALLTGVQTLQAFEEAFQGELAPDWYWELVDTGGDHCRGGISVDAIAHYFNSKVLERRDTHPNSYLATEPIRNRLLRAWEIVCAHYQTVSIPLPANFDISHFARYAEETIHRHWMNSPVGPDIVMQAKDIHLNQQALEQTRVRIYLKAMIIMKAEDIHLNQQALKQNLMLIYLKAWTNSDLSHNKCLTAPFWEAWKQGLAVHEAFAVAHYLIASESSSPGQHPALCALQRLATPFGGYAPWTSIQGASEAIQKMGRDIAEACLGTASAYKPRNHANATQYLLSSEQHDEVGFMDDRWKADKRKMSPTRLWRELPQSRKSESHRKLAPPWKKQGNPPLQDRSKGSGPRAPRTPPPTRTPAKAKSRPGACRTAEVATEAEQKEQDEEIETVELEEEEREMTTEDAMAVWQALLEMQHGEDFNLAAPMVPSHIADNIVETLVDRPEAQHNLLSDTLARLGRAGSSNDHEKADKETTLGDREEEGDEECLMQTTIPQATAAAAAAASSEDQLLHRLHKAIQALPPSTASSRAIRLSALLQDYDGPLTIDRSLLESLLVASNEEIPPLPGGAEYDRVDEMLARREQQERDAEQAEHEAREAMYMRGLEAAAERHYETLKSEAAQAEDDRILTTAMGYTRSRPKQSLGLCVTNGKLVKAWDFEINPEAPVQIHIKAEAKEWKGQWYKAGVPVPEATVPEEVRELAMPSSSSSSMPPPGQGSFDISKPATRNLFERWRSREISPQAVVGIGGTGLLAYFHAVADIPDEVWAELGERDTLTLEPPAGQNAPTNHEDPPGNAPEATEPPPSKPSVYTTAKTEPDPEASSGFDLARGLPAHLREAHAADLIAAIAKGEDEDAWLERELAAAVDAGGRLRPPGERGCPSPQCRRAPAGQWPGSQSRGRGQKKWQQDWGKDWTSKQPASWQLWRGSRQSPRAKEDRYDLIQVSESTSTPTEPPQAPTGSGKGDLMREVQRSLTAARKADNKVRKLAEEKKTRATQWELWAQEAKVKFRRQRKQYEDDIQKIDEAIVATTAEGESAAQLVQDLVAHGLAAKQQRQPMEDDSAWDALMAEEETHPESGFLKDALLAARRATSAPRTAPREATGGAIATPDAAARLLNARPTTAGSSRATDGCDYGGHPVPPAIPVPLAAADEGRVPQTGHTAAAPVLAPPGLPVPATSPEAKRPVAPKRQSVKTLTKPEAPSLGGTSLGDKLSERRQAILGETPSGDHQEERPPEPRMPARISIHEDDDSDDALAEEE